MGTCQGKSQKHPHKNKRGNNEDENLREVSEDEYREANDNSQSQSAKEAEIKEIPFEHYAFPFENVAFEGGGCKTLAYCGAVKVLEEVGIWNQIRRLSGSSTGSLMAALLAVGYNSQELQEFLSQDIRAIFLDNTNGTCSMVPNLLKFYSWNPGQRMLTWLGGKLKQATGKSDVTFMEIYQMYGKELCVIVTNLNQASAEYCHPKTTPDMPVRVAIRMSMSLPGMYKPIVYKWNGKNDVFVDGGILCNYPVHCFDGWWLSLHPDDAFVKRLPALAQLKRDQLEDRFQQFNDCTIGLMVYSDDEQDAFEKKLEGLKKLSKPDTLPNTELRRNHEKHDEGQDDSESKYIALAAAVDKFLQTLKVYNVDKTRTISRNDLKNAMAKVRLLAEGSDLSEDDLKLLFGEKITPEDIFIQIDASNADQMSYPELVGYLERRGLPLQAKYQAHKRRDIRTLADYVLAVHEAMSSNTRKTVVQKSDIQRTVGIHTCYIGTRNFELESEDRDFLVEILGKCLDRKFLILSLRNGRLDSWLRMGDIKSIWLSYFIKQGKRAARDFLFNYVARRSPPLKADFRKSYCRDDLLYIDDDTSEIINMGDYNEDFIRVVL